MIYINAIASNYTLHKEIKELIPNALQRRRMSDIVKLGVAVGMECFAQCQCDLDGIITSTGFGCLSDSEKFLDNLIENDEQLLSPTPFIQSTFNTIGGQLAIMIGCNAYNITYSHRNTSFESALLDAALQISLGDANNILLGAFDLNTVTLINLLQRMHINTNERKDGVYFFLLSSQKTKNSIASIQIPEFKKIDQLEKDDKITNIIKYEISSAAHLFDFLHRKLGNGLTLINQDQNSATIFKINIC